MQENRVQESRRQDAAALEPFETETMADLHAQQGRPGEALAILRRLADSHPGHPREGRWNKWMAELRAQIAQQGGGPPALPDYVPIPVAPGVTAVAGHNEDGATEAVVAWALPATPSPPVLEVLLILRDATGVETVRQRIPVSASSGRVSVPMDRLQAVAAAAGYLAPGDRFVPVARSTAS